MSQRTEGRTTNLDGLVGVARLMGAVSVRSCGDSLFVSFAESDFIIRLDRPTSDEHWTANWTVTVREPSPGLGTWWGRWRHSFTASPAELSTMLAGQIGEAVLRVRARLDEHLSPSGADASVARVY